MFGDILQELRRDADLTQDELAQRFNMNRTTLSKYETNENEPNLEFLSMVSDYFNVSIDYLLGKTRVYTPVYTLQEFNNCSPDTYKKLSNILVKLSRNKKYIDFTYSVLNELDKFK